MFTVCSASHTLPNGITINFSTNETFTETLTTINGCDSIIITNYEIGQSNNFTTTITDCDSYFWPANGVNYDSTGTYTLLTNKYGCDSILTLNLTIINSSSTSSDVTALIDWNGTTYAASG